jgi:hypothetical protein
MLALDDGAFARLFIAASAVPHRRRARWLRRIARQLDPSPNALHCRGARERQRSGLTVYHLLLETVGIEALLEREQLLRAGADHSRREVEAALRELITALTLVSFDMSVEPNSENAP